MTQTFKGDILEQKFIDAGTAAFDSCSISLDEYFEDGYQSADFLLMLYDAGRMPFSDRVPRESFVSFIKQAIPNFPVTGTFEAYLFIIRSIFGDASLIQFDVPAPGKLEMVVNAEAALAFDWQARQIEDGSYVYYDMQTNDFELLQFRGISGIDSEAELKQLLAELIPAGISPDITLTFFTLSMFVAEDNLGNLDSVVDDLGNQIVFYETGE